jgi:hypothetical protein
MAGSGSPPVSRRRDIHPVAEDVLAFCNDIAEIDPDAELDPLLRGDGRILLDYLPLHLDRAAHGVHDTRKFRQEAVAGVLYGTALVLLDLRTDQLREMRLEPLVRPLLIRPHQARIPRHIGG